MVARYTKGESILYHSDAQGSSSLLGKAVRGQLLLQGIFQPRQNVVVSLHLLSHK